MITKFKLFERKGNYQLYHKTDSLKSIIDSGYIIAGGGNDDVEWWDIALRKNVFPNMDKKGPKTISATRNLEYMSFYPALELDVEKISDKYRIVPYSENPDFYLALQGGWTYDKPIKYTLGGTSKMNILQRQLRSKDVGDVYWKVKTDQEADDFGISEELIVTDKLSVEKYVKRIILDVDYADSKILNQIKKKYPNIEVVITDEKRGYSDIKKAIKQKELVYQESFDYEDDPRDDDPMNKYTEVIGYGKVINIHTFNNKTLDFVDSTLRGLIRDYIDFDFYQSENNENIAPHTEYLIILKGDWKNKIKDNLLPSTEGDQWYINPITGSDWYGTNWIKIDDIETRLDAKKYNV